MMGDEASAHPLWNRARAIAVGAAGRRSLSERRAEVAREAEAVRERIESSDPGALHQVLSSLLLIWPAASCYRVSCSQLPHADLIATMVAGALHYRSACGKSSERSGRRLCCGGRHSSSGSCSSGRTCHCAAGQSSARLAAPVRTRRRQRRHTKVAGPLQGVVAIAAAAAAAATSSSPSRARARWRGSSRP
jgi:hypothetical protein